MSSNIRKVFLFLEGPFRFLRHVISEFLANQGFLLSAAVAYYMLLSIVPMFAVILVALSQLTDTQQLLQTAETYLELVTPGKSAVLIGQVEVFLVNWKLVGVTGLLSLLFFSSLAFTALGRAMSVIFHHRITFHRRYFLVAAIIPYLYILLMALGLFVVSALIAALDTVGSRDITLLGSTWSLDGASGGVIYLFGLLGEIALLTSLYLVFPVGRSAFRHALIGGIAATVLWELTRHFLVWYFSTLSQVNMIYGSFASVIIILLSCEAAALILLLGAQVIAVYERDYSEKAVS